MIDPRRSIKIAYIGGGSQNWAPTVIRDIIFKPGLDAVHLDFHLLDIDAPRLHAIRDLFAAKLKEWKLDRVTVHATQDKREALAGADFVIITIATGRLEAMRHDLAIPEKYGIYHTVGDTAGPGGWSRALRNIPVFLSYARLIKEVAPEAYVLNYSNPLGALTKVLAGELGLARVVGLCHGLYESYQALQTIFGLTRETDIQMQFGGLNHFFWTLDFKINGHDGYAGLREKLEGRSFADLLDTSYRDAFGFGSDRLVASELYENFGYLPYVGDRHTCEFFNCYIANLKTQERFKLKRTTIEERQDIYDRAADRIARWTAGKEADASLTNKPSRETAADIIKAIAFNEGFTDVVNLVNTGQVSNLPRGTVVETMGYVRGSGFQPLAVGSLPEAIRSIIRPHTSVQAQTVAAGMVGDAEAALMALAVDPACAHLTISDLKRMGRELIEANRPFAARAEC